MAEPTRDDLTKRALLVEVLDRLDEVNQILAHVLQWQGETTRRFEALMSVATDIKDLTKKIDDATNSVADRITRLSSQITNAMSDAEVAEVKAGLQAEADKLGAMGKDPDNPVPPPP